jgi:nucleotide-binding universal stress UspA family protein
MLIKKILCPIDLSENAKTGMAYAVSLAREHKAELIFFHVTRFPYWELAYPCEPDLLFQQRRLPPRFSIDDLFKVAASRVRNLVHADFGAEVLGLSWKASISLGNVAHEIVAAAVVEKTDLIIMAKRKRGLLVRLFARSISEAVSEKAPCPVLSLCPPQIMQDLFSGKGAGFLRVPTGSEA